MLNISNYIPEELHNLNNKRNKLFNINNTKPILGDYFEKFIEDKFNNILQELNTMGENKYIADFGLHVEGQDSNEYDIIIYKNIGNTKLQIQSVFELKDRNLEGIFSIYDKYVKFIVNNKGKTYGNVLYPSNIKYYGLINIHKSEGNIQTLLMNYSSLIINGLFYHPEFNRNYLKLYEIISNPTEISMRIIKEIKDNIDKKLDEIKYYFLAIKTNYLETPLAGKRRKRIVKTKNENSKLNNSIENIGDFFIEELNKFPDMEIVDGKNIINGIKNNCILFNKDGSINEFLINDFILNKLLSKDNIEKNINDNQFIQSLEFSIKNAAIELFRYLIKNNTEKIDEILKKLNKMIEESIKKQKKKITDLETAKNKVSNSKKSGIQERINKETKIFDSIPSSDDILNNLKIYIPEFYSNINAKYGIDIQSIMK
jgi:hypothetical protein